MKKRLLRLIAFGLLAATLFAWAFSHGLGIWTIDWDNPAFPGRGCRTQLNTSTASWWPTSASTG